MTKSNINKARILIADDEPVIRNILSRKLIGEGYECTEASDGTRALNELKTCTFDLVLLDINMPGKSGTDVLREMRAKYPDTAVIMITAISDVGTAIKSMKMGAHDYVIKPVDLKMLLVSVDRALDKRRLILENKSYQLHLEEKVEEQTREIRESFLNSIKSLAFALEAKDKYTSGHSQRVSEIATAIARELGVAQDYAEKMSLAGLVHDIGKIGLRESVLNKPGKISDEEYDHIKSHSETGERILSPIIQDKEILDMVRHHHERYDGNGYPDGLQAEQIPQGARILAVADAYVDMSGNQAGKEVLSQGARILAVADSYDAMTSDRPYREAMSPELAISELERGQEKQFDPIIVAAFIRVLSKGGLKMDKDHKVWQDATVAPE